MDSQQQGYDVLQDQLDNNPYIREIEITLKGFVWDDGEKEYTRDEDRIALINDTGVSSVITEVKGRIANVNTYSNLSVRDVIDIRESIYFSLYWDIFKNRDRYGVYIVENRKKKVPKQDEQGNYITINHKPIHKKVYEDAYEQLPITYKLARELWTGAEGLFLYDANVSDPATENTVTPPKPGRLVKNKGQYKLYRHYIKESREELKDAKGNVVYDDGEYVYEERVVPVRVYQMHNIVRVCNIVDDSVRLFLNKTVNQRGMQFIINLLKGQITKTITQESKGKGDDNLFN